MILWNGFIYNLVGINFFHNFFHRFHAPFWCFFGHSPFPFLVMLCCCKLITLGMLCCGFFIAQCFCEITSCRHEGFLLCARASSHLLFFRCRRGDFRCLCHLFGCRCSCRFLLVLFLS